LASAAQAVADSAMAWETAAYAKYFHTKAELRETAGAAVLDEIAAERAESPDHP
jgi:hypothetical protein